MKLDSIGRQSRFDPTVIGGSFRVTDRDVQVLQLLQRYRYLPSDYIPVLLQWKGDWYKRVVYKLNRRAGFIFVPPASLQAANARYRPMVYALTGKGEEELKRRGLYAGAKKTGHQFNHELMVCLIGASFEIGARDHGLQLIAKDEILNHSNCPPSTRNAVDPWAIPVSFTYKNHYVEQQVETDGEFFGLALPNGNRRISLIFPGFEADRRTEPLEPQSYERSGIQRKFLAFREIVRQGIYRSRYGIPNAIIPFITVNVQHMQSMMRVVEKITDGNGSKLFIFKSIPNFAAFEKFPTPTGHMISEPWLRVSKHGSEKYSILDQLNGIDSNRVRLTGSNELATPQ